MPDWLAPLLLPAAGTALSLILARLVAGRVAKRFAAIGGQEAQAQLTRTLQDNEKARAEALKLRDDRIETLERQAADCKERIEELAGREAGWRRERLQLKQEISDLHSEIRELSRAAGR